MTSDLFAASGIAAAAVLGALAVHAGEAGAANPRIPPGTYGQHLLDVALHDNSQVLVVAMHAKPPGFADNVIVASNIGRIGKRADADDQAVMTTGQSRLKVDSTGDRLEIEEVLRDVSGATIGALGVVFPYKAGDDQHARRFQAEAIGAGLARRIAHAGNLLDLWPYDAKFSDNTYAQRLVDETLAAHPEVIILAIHATPPGSRVNVILGSNIGRIGKKADADDLRVIDKGETNREVGESGDRFEAEVPLLDAAGRRIGALGVVFKFGPDSSKDALTARAIAIRDALARQIPSAARLARPAR